MKKVLLASIGIAILALSGAANAANLSRPAPVYKALPPEAIYNWSGCYVGASGGGKSGKSDHVNQTAPNSGSNLAGEFDVSGGIAGGQIGCNYQTGAWVFGIEGDDSWTNAGGDARNVAPFNTNFQNETNEKWLATIRGRLGYATGPVLLYATAGGAFAGVEANSFNVTAPAPASTFSEKKTMVGWTAGAGVEWGFAPGWSAKAEYLFVDLGTERFFDSAANTCCAVRDVDVWQHIGRVGINYRFGAGSPVVARY